METISVTKDTKKWSQDQWKTKRPSSMMEEQKEQLKPGEMLIKRVIYWHQGRRKYVPISPKNIELLIKYSKNKYGEKVKVILGSKTAAEGLMILRLRQVHILEPWFHLNRMEQIVGK